jgi:hypothetical protein
MKHLFYFFVTNVDLNSKYAILWIKVELFSQERVTFLTFPTWYDVGEYILFQTNDKKRYNS